MKEAPFCTLLFYQVLVKAHQDTSRLGADGGASRVDGAIVMAVNQLVAVGPGHGGYSPILHGIAIEEKAQTSWRSNHNSCTQRNCTVSYTNAIQTANSRNIIVCHKYHPYVFRSLDFPKFEQ